MKHLLLLFIIYLCPLIVSAQSHMSFMGIPINGTINEFTNKLATKGIKVAPENKNNKNLDSRYFKGVFNGYNSNIIVEFNPRTKLVYAVSVGMKVHDQLKEEIFEDVRNNIENKYDCIPDEIDSITGEVKYNIYNSKGQRYGLITTDCSTSQYQSYVTVVYWDLNNFYKSSDTNKSDL